MVWKKSDDPSPTPQPSFSPPAPSVSAPSRPSARTGAASLLGPSLTFEGEVTGAEDLTVDGRLVGRIQLPDNKVLIGSDGRVEADIKARSVRVRGHVQGDLHGGEEVVVEAGGSVRGNIIAPRVVLEDGAKFKGAIDMEPEKPAGNRASAAAGRSSAPPQLPAGADSARDAKTPGATPASGGS